MLRTKMLVAGYTTACDMVKNQKKETRSESTVIDYVRNSLWAFYNVIQLSSEI
jgi:hypothetical protein